ncbi:hypothetical protein [Leptospira adleri]|uniref:hypothetical protein n=1 Tax=Leptospira adleri TaxID=2023186 RepID=UPI0013FD5409|nr:hypothetical protein [Leptospira adleri]
MKTSLTLLSAWILWLHSVRGNIFLGEFNTQEECRAAIREDATHLLTWKTSCRETR